MSLIPYTGAWTRSEAAHLLRRTLFGPTHQQISAIANMSMNDAVNQLLTVGSLNPPLAYDAGETVVAQGQTWVSSLYPSNPVSNQLCEAHQVQFYSLAGTCNVSLEEQALANGSMLVYPNPTPSSVHVKVNLAEGRAMGELRDAHGATVKMYFDQNFSSGVHTIFCDMDGLASGTYFLVIRNNEKTLLEQVVKMK